MLDEEGKAEMKKRKDRQAYTVKMMCQDIDTEDLDLEDSLLHP